MVFRVAANIAPLALPGHKERANSQELRCPPAGAEYWHKAPGNANLVWRAWLMLRDDALKPHKNIKSPLVYNPALARQ